MKKLFSIFALIPSLLFGAMDFEFGSSQWVDLGTGLTSLQNVSGATVMAWINLESTSATEYFAINISNGLLATNSRARIGKNGGTNEYRAGGRRLDAEVVSNANSAGAIPTGERHHIAAVLDYTGGNLYLYVDGVLTTTTVVVGWIGNSSNTASLNSAIGAIGSGASNFWDGILDDGRVYSRAMSSTEIATINAAQGRDSIVYGLVHRWRFNEAASGATATGTNTVMDQMGNRDGTPTASPVYANALVTWRHRKK